MKILLVNPAYAYQTPWLQIAEPLGLLYLASYLRANTPHEVSILDCLDNHQIVKTGPSRYWYGLSHADMLKHIEACHPDIVGITCLFSKKKDDYLSAAAQIRSAFPGVTMVAGGTYASLFPEEVMKTGIFDYCVIGEGEESLRQLVDSIDRKTTPLESIEGLAFKKDGAVTITPRVTYITDLDRIPFPARDLINYEAYVTRKSVLHGLGMRRSASILTSRSCPNRCNFCSMFKVHGQRWRGRSAGNVVAEIEEMTTRYGIQDLFIMDDNFTFKAERVRQICEEIMRRGIRIKWNTPNGISINTLSKDLLRTMQASGCTSICIAIESGDEELRNQVIGKRLSDKKIEEVTTAAAELGIYVTAFYIIGMPGETEEKFERTLAQLKNYPFNAVAASFANPLPGTKLYDDCSRNNWRILANDEQQKNLLYTPFIITDDFTELDLQVREKRFYRTFLRAKFFTILRDALLFRNWLLYPPFLMRILKDRLFRN